MTSPDKALPYQSEDLRCLADTQWANREPVTYGCQRLGICPVALLVSSKREVSAVHTVPNKDGDLEPYYPPVIELEGDCAQGPPSSISRVSAFMPSTTPGPLWQVT